MRLLATILASLPPLLTFCALWQIKEWRIDRLYDHLRTEGALRQIFGIARVPLTAAWYVTAAVGMLTGQRAADGALASLVILGAAQFLRRHQRLPVWTAKSIMVCGASVGITAAAAAVLRHSGLHALPLLVLLQPLVCALVWSALLPLDTILKSKILRRAGELRKQHPNLVVIGVTGSVGKTTTKELVACALGADALSTPAYVNSEIGVARWLIQTLSKDKKTLPKVLVVEMGAYRTGEIAKLCRCAKPTIGVITYVGTQHIALFGSQEGIVRAKGELLAAVPEQGQAFLNADCERVLGMRDRCSCPVTTVGTGGNGDLQAYDIEETSQGLRMRIGTTMFHVAMHGTQNASNILLAVAVAEHLGVQRNVVANRLARFKPLVGTFCVQSRDGVTVLDDTHNCSPESASAAVRWATVRDEREKVLLTSGIIEQGMESERVHRELGAQCAGTFRRVIFTNKRFAQIFEQGYGKTVEIYSDTIPRVPRGSLLVCLGRVPAKAVERMIPLS
ncbi:UDP-N-acetylmuramoyl-tripeptide--D-alanyl-D-alanine ligase [Candidatus Peribacteria bacterium]|nr:UDP-N-acetylmuramoyl-tripeptide--D-alanyl-D-alanine ligase [Candidatus Peribacteria bacterium]